MRRILTVVAAALAVAAVVFSCRGRRNAEPDAESAQADSVLVGHSWQKVDPLDLELKPVANFSQGWMALATGSAKQYNAMTIAW